MPVAAGVAGAITAGAAVVSTAATVAFGVKGMIAQKKAAALQTKLNNIRAARERMNQFRQARIAQGQIANQAALYGTSGASSVEAGRSSVSSQLSSNLSFIDQQVALQSDINTLTGKADRATGWANMITGAMSGVTDFASALPRTPPRRQVAALVPPVQPYTYSGMVG